MTPSPIQLHVHGLGAVSPAGWGVPPLLAAVAAGEPLPVSPVGRPGGRPPLGVRRVPPRPPGPPGPAHPRLRRASPVSHFALAAAREAFSGRPATAAPGVVFCVTAGCVQYSRRFYAEVLADPATASPLVFPETVFNAPASHISACLGSVGPNYTLVGDGGHLAAGLELAALWLEDGLCEACLVVAAEESDWLVADALRRFRRRDPTAEGAGALLVSRDPVGAIATVSAVCTAPVFAGPAARRAALRALDADIAARVGPGALRVPGPGGDGSPARVLGEGFSAGAAWQAVIAAEAVASGRHPASVARLTGPQNQAGAVVFSGPPCRAAGPGPG